MDMPDIKELVKTIIETEIVKALNSAPDAIEKLVKAALSKPIGKDGRFDGYGDKMPYLEYLVGEEIRLATANAVRKVVQEQTASIETMVRAGLSSESVVAAVTKALVSAAADSWRINVSFEKEER